ncbi:MAG: GNAT family N-acetyltransferase [Anaerolineae bacterium]|nr:GNAT family N-acetyltransferase [Anaerolineae bacterium]
MRPSVEGLVFQVIMDTAGFEALCADWTSLLEESGCREMFLTWEWQFAWWKHHQAGNDLRIITARRDGRLEAVAPLMIITKPKYGRVFREVVMLGYPDIDVAGFLLREPYVEVLRDICRYLVNRRDWDVLQIMEIPAEGFEGRELASAFRAAGCGTYIIDDVHYYLPILTDWQAYYDQLPHPLTGYLRKQLKAISKVGELSYRVFCGPDLRWEHFEAMFALNAKSRYAYLYATEEERAFARALFDLTQGRDWVEIDLLYLGEQPVAFNHGFNMGGRHEGWRMGFDGDYYKYGPGKLLSMHMIRSYFERGFRELDLLRGVESYKNEWQPLPRRFIHLRAVPRLKLLAVLDFLTLPRLHVLWNQLIARLRPPHSEEPPAQG